MWKRKPNALVKPRIQPWLQSGPLRPAGCRWSSGRRCRPAKTRQQLRPGAVYAAVAQPVAGTGAYTRAAPFLGRLAAPKTSRQLALARGAPLGGEEAAAADGHIIAHAGGPPPGVQILENLAIGPQVVGR